METREPSRAHERSSAQEPSSTIYLLDALAGVILGLLLVGMVSHLVIRHIIQVTLAAIAAVFVARGGRAARYAALPIFVAFAAQSILTSTFTNPWFWGLPPLAYAVPSLCYP